MIYKQTFYWYFLRWLIGFGDIVDGICMMITFGFYSPNLGLRISFKAAKHFKHQKNSEKKMGISRSVIFLIFKVATIVLAGILWVAVMKLGQFPEGKEIFGKIFITFACLGMVAIPFVLEWRFGMWGKEQEGKELKKNKVGSVNPDEGERWIKKY